MRLLDTKTGQFVDKDPENEETVYAILSHTWDSNGEQKYEELRTIQRRYAPEFRAPQSRPSFPDGGASSPERDPGVSSPTTILQYTRSQSLFARGVARLKTWLRYRSDRIAPNSSSGSPSITTRLKTFRRHRSAKNNRDGPSPALPGSSQRLRDSEPPSVILHPPTAVEHSHTDVEAPAHTPNDHSASGPELQSNPSPSQESIWHDCKISPKIWHACAVARKNGYDYIWIDSCCIDKSSSSELSEAINSMYKWYGLATVCYTYLADVPPGDDHQAEGSAFRKSKWFTRGWTLQELIAPVSMEFLSQDWAPIGSKHALDTLVESVTKIDRKALLHLEPLDTFSIAKRLSWAATRETTRKEDRAYSLLGIFNINMPTLYGEGDRAFRRLQEQIMQRVPDQSLFAWGGVSAALSMCQSFQDPGPAEPGTSKAVRVGVSTLPPLHHLFAFSPVEFRGCKAVGTARYHADEHSSGSSNRHKIAYTSTPYGIATQFQMIPLTRELIRHAIPRTEEIDLEIPKSKDGSQWFFAILQCEHGEHPGRLLGRVCYVTPSEQPDVNFVYTGHINIKSEQGYRLELDLVLLSSETVELFRSDTELKTVYIPHPDRANILSILRTRPYIATKLVLSRETRDALRVQGYSAELRDPDPDRPTTQWLTLSKDGYTVIVEFRHALRDGGQRFVINGKAKMSRTHGPPDSSPDSDRADRYTWATSWTDKLSPWLAEVKPKRARLSATGAGVLTVDIGLGFMGGGNYSLHIDVLSSARPAYSALDPAVDQAEKVEEIEEGSQPGERKTAG